MNSWTTSRVGDSSLSRFLALVYRSTGTILKPNLYLLNGVLTEEMTRDQLMRALDKVKLRARKLFIEYQVMK